DAPALKKADIGVAMGITGTDVAKEAAVMILTDDNFATIIRAVENGRALYDNLMKYIRFQMGSLFSLIMTFLGAGLFNILAGIPFLPLQVLWVNFTVQLFLAIGLGLGSPTPGLMQRPPRSAQAQILPLPLAVQLVVIGLVMTAATLGVMQWVLVGMHLSEPVARTMGLTTFSLASIFFALETNDQRRSIFSRETLESRKLLQMCGWALLATFLVTILEFLNRIFAMSNLTVGQWVICIAAGAVVIVIGEIAKIVRRRRPHQEESFPREAQEVQ
ncbi:MAG TPA: cation transporting ATPase C-terminal domain-containing protein, partial [Ktedonobacteraceae bacterium]|nr:cation transporting ATPase C-terminal domain-containing protein [Ktedonobacteraceae bacterium]